MRIVNMKELILDMHSVGCEARKLHYFENWCYENPKTVLILIKNKFYLLTYFHCAECGDHPGFVQDIIHRITGNSKIFESYLVERGGVDNDLKEYRIRGKQLKKYTQQINYLYYDNASREFAVTTKTDYMEAIVDHEILTENFKLANEFLLNNEKHKSLLYSLERLYYMNFIGVNDIEIVNTIDNLIKQINKN